MMEMAMQGSLGAKDKTMGQRQRNLMSMSSWLRIRCKMAWHQMLWWTNKVRLKCRRRLSKTWVLMSYMSLMLLWIRQEPRCNRPWLMTRTRTWTAKSPSSWTQISWLLTTCMETQFTVSPKSQSTQKILEALYHSRNRISMIIWTTSISAPTCMTWET